MRILPRIAGVVIAAGLGACGGSDKGPTVQATPTPPVARIVAQGAGVPVYAGYAEWVYFSVPTAGTITITVDYTFSDSSLGVWLTPGHCTWEMSDAHQCSWVVRSFTSVKPRVITQSVPTGEHTLVIDNIGTRDENASYQVVFTAASATAYSTGVAASAAAARPLDTAGPSGPRPSRRSR